MQRFGSRGPWKGGGRNGRAIERAADSDLQRQNYMARYGLLRALEQQNATA